MKSFIRQFKKAKQDRLRLIYDKINSRYLITKNANWQNWNGCTLIKNFNNP